MRRIEKEIEQLMQDDHELDEFLIDDEDLEFYAEKADQDYYTVLDELNDIDDKDNSFDEEE